jgi:hypothetical protein
MSDGEGFEPCIRIVQGKSGGYRGVIRQFGAPVGSTGYWESPAQAWEASRTLCNLITGHWPARPEKVKVQECE